MFGCCCGCTDVIFPATSPQRFVQGTLLMIAGSLLWLVFEQLDRRDDDSRTDPNLQRVTNKTAIIIACVIFYSSIVALVLHILSIRIIKRQQEEAVESDRDRRQRERMEEKEGRTLWEWFFYPEHETIPASRQAKKIRQFQTT